MQSVERGEILCQIKDVLAKDQQRKIDIFSTLDNDKSESGQTFISFASKFEKALLCSLRDKREGFEGRTLLHNAAKLGKLAIVNYLIAVGHNVNVIDSSVTRITPLMDAVSFGEMEVALALTEAGANLFTQDIREENILHVAARNGSAQLVFQMLKAARLSASQIQSLASVTSARLKFPEDLASNNYIRGVLVDLRTTGVNRRLSMLQR